MHTVVPAIVAVVVLLCIAPLSRAAEPQQVSPDELVPCLSEEGLCFIQGGRAPPELQPGFNATFGAAASLEQPSAVANGTANGSGTGAQSAAQTSPVQHHQQQQQQQQQSGDSATAEAGRQKAQHLSSSTATSMLPVTTSTQPSTTTARQLSSTTSEAKRLPSVATTTAQHFPTGAKQQATTSSVMPTPSPAHIVGSFRQPSGNGTPKPFAPKVVQPPQIRVPAATMRPRVATTPASQRTAQHRNTTPPSLPRKVTSTRRPFTPARLPTLGVINGTAATTAPPRVQQPTDAAAAQPPVVQKTQHSVDTRTRGRNPAVATAAPTTVAAPQHLSITSLASNGTTRSPSPVVKTRPIGQHLFNGRKPNLAANNGGRAPK